MKQALEAGTRTRAAPPIAALDGHSWTNYVMPYAMQNQSVDKRHPPTTRP